MILDKTLNEPNVVTAMPWERSYNPSRKAQLVISQMERTVII